MLFRRRCTDVSPVQCYLDLLSIKQGFYLCNVVPRVLRQHWTWFFYVQCCLEPLEQHRTRILPVAVQCCSKRIKTARKRIFSCTMFYGTSRTTLHRVFPVQCCPRSIKTTLHRIFSYSMLFGASWATLHNISTCVMFSKSIKRTLNAIFSLNVVWTLLDNMHQAFTCTTLFQEC